MKIIKCNPFEWQYPAITEKFAYEQIRANAYIHELSGYYIAFPWATIVDSYHKKIVLKEYNGSLNQYIQDHYPMGKFKHPLVFTVCQTVYYRDFIPYFKKIGINRVYTPHAIEKEYTPYLKKVGIAFLPFPLYPVNSIGPAPKKDIFYSFIGCTSYSSSNRKVAAQRATKIRTALISLPNLPATIMESLDQWHFYDSVYNKQIYQKKRSFSNIQAEERRANRFKDTLARSRYSICPGGMGPSSIRFWESLAAGSIPVNISDDFWLPEGDIDWTTCSITLAENELSNLQERLAIISSEEEEELRKATLEAANVYKGTGFIHTILKDLKKNEAIFKVNSIRKITNRYQTGINQLIFPVYWKLMKICNPMLNKYSIFDKIILIILLIFSTIGIAGALLDHSLYTTSGLTGVGFVFAAYMLLIFRQHQRDFGTFRDTMKIRLKQQNNRQNSQESSRNIPSVYGRMQHAQKLGFSPKVIIDGGANRGKWTKWTSRIFPKATYLCVEPNSSLNQQIKETIGTNTSKYKIANVALGKDQSKGKLNIWGDSSGASLLAHVNGIPQQIIDIEIITIDALCQQHNIQPNLIKLDLQGGEIDALNGAREALKTCEMVITEFGCLDAYIGRTSNRDLFNLMYANDYCLYDIVDMHYRPYDGALTGGDFIFVKNNSVLRKYKGYE